MKTHLHAFIDVPRDLALDEQALFIGRLMSMYHGTREPNPIHIGCECYSVVTYGEPEEKIEQKLLEDLHYDGKLFILVSDERHVTPELAASAAVTAAA